MKLFIGRTPELAELEATARLPGAKFIVIKGRRGVGAVAEAVRETDYFDRVVDFGELAVA